MRARMSSRSASGTSIVNGRTAVASTVFSTRTVMWILLGIGDGARARDDGDRGSVVADGPHCWGSPRSLAEAPLGAYRGAAIGFLHSPTTGVEVKAGSAPLGAPARGSPLLCGPMAVTYERKGAAAVLTIDRQERRNAVDGPTADQLEAGYERFVEDDDARVLILTGGGDVAFCAGADLKAIETLGPRLTSENGPLGFTRRISPKPTIAAISGWCLAGGMELALWCDLRIAAQGSTFGFTERRLGVPLIDGGTQRLPRIVGLGRALDIILSGRLVPAEEALSIGLLTEIVPAGQHLARALEYAEALARFPQETMLADRRAAIAGIGMTFEEGLRMESAAGLETYEAAQRGAARFAAGEGRGAAGTGA